MVKKIYVNLYCFLMVVLILIQVPTMFFFCVFILCFTLICYSLPYSGASSSHFCVFFSSDIAVPSNLIPLVFSISYDVSEKLFYST